MDFADLQVGQQQTVGGSNIDVISIGPVHYDLTLDVYAWHTGYKTGEGNSAVLILSADGAEIGKAEDSNFDNYSLPIAKRLVVQTGATITLSIRISNHMATERSHGLQVTVVR